jgi:two-component system CAI-1 autoinducer sensor kinase/phosphatase CqsS
MRSLSEGKDLLRAWAANEVVRPLLEPVLHPSQWRIRALGLSIAIGHPLFYLFWTQWSPQPYESLWQRLAIACMGLCVLLPWISSTPPSRLSATVYSVIFWITLPVFFFWMYLCNGGNEVWMGSMAAMFLIYYHLTDWRLATLGTITGLAAGWGLFQAFGPEVPPFTAQKVGTHVMVLGFSWYMGLVLGISTSNLRREQLTYTLATMGIMAHELRTPIATMALIGDALRNEAAERGSEASLRLEQLATRLIALVRNMNHQIDMQISNARLTRLPTSTEVVSAATLVKEVVAAYPYRSSRERACVTVQIHSDFRFRGSQVLFSQVLDNLIKNALRSLAAATTASEPGDLSIDVGAAKDRGRIALTDRGVGMAEDLQARIFQPFFSTNRNTGHGLGLAFCQRVVEAAGGSIRVKSVPLRGATFILELPTVS